MPFTCTKTRQIIRYLGTVTLRRPQIKSPVQDINAIHLIDNERQGSWPTPDQGLSLHETVSKAYTSKSYELEIVQQ